MIDELVAVYDADGNVVGAAPRSRVYAEGLWHASAGVLVRSVDGLRIYVHRRTTTKAVFAGMHDCLAGGVVDPGGGDTVAGRNQGIGRGARYQWLTVDGAGRGGLGRAVGGKAHALSPVCV